MKKTTLFFFSLGCLLLLLPKATVVVADEGNRPVDRGFNYKPIQPENQRNRDIRYFDLKMSPGQKQTVQIELINNSDLEKNIDIEANGAKTNSNGVIESGSNTIEDDKSLKYKFTDVVKVPKQVHLAPQEHVMVDMEISMPTEPFDGFLYGGIQLKEAVDEEAEKKQVGVINEYAFVIGVLLSESDKKIEPELKLNKVYAGQTNARNTIFVNLSNNQPSFLDYLTLEVQITEKNTKDILYDTKKSNMRMAPNTLLDYPISMQGDSMVPGEYMAHILATSGSLRWEWNQPFKITDEEADKFNKQDVSLTQDPGINWKLIVLIVGAVLAVLLIVFVLLQLLKRSKKGKGRSIKRKIKKK